jgi:hypothetical protein
MPLLFGTHLFVSHLVFLTCLFTLVHRGLMSISYNLKIIQLLILNYNICDLYADKYIVTLNLSTCNELYY